MAGRSLVGSVPYGILSLEFAVMQHAFYDLRSGLISIVATLTSLATRHPPKTWQRTSRVAKRSIAFPRQVLARYDNRVRVPRLRD